MRNICWWSSREGRRRMSHKTKFSRNWRTAKVRVQRIHRQIANSSNDYMHKASQSISKNQAVLCVEDLQVSKMSRYCSTLDQGWCEFRRRLEYKSCWAGGDVLAEPAQNTSRQCPVCGHTETAD